jgi:hypothetical protein
LQFAVKPRWRAEKPKPGAGHALDLAEQGRCHPIRTLERIFPNFALSLFTIIFLLSGVLSGFDAEQFCILFYVQQYHLMVHCRNYNGDRLSNFNEIGFLLVYSLGKSRFYRISSTVNPRKNFARQRCADCASQNRSVNVQKSNALSLRSAIRRIAAPPSQIDGSRWVQYSLQLLRRFSTDFSACNRANLKRTSHHAIRLNLDHTYGHSEMATCGIMRRQKTRTGW